METDTMWMSRDALSVKYWGVIIQHKAQRVSLVVVASMSTKHVMYESCVVSLLRCCFILFGSLKEEHFSGVCCLIYEGLVHNLSPALLQSLLWIYFCLVLKAASLTTVTKFYRKKSGRILMFVLFCAQTAASGWNKSVFVAQRCGPKL